MKGAPTFAFCDAEDIGNGPVPSLERDKRQKFRGYAKHSCLWLEPVPACLYRLVSEPTTHHARTKGFSRISSPSNVSGPCPVTTVARSSSVYKRCLIDRTIVAWSPPHKSVRPTPRRNKVSPAISSLASANQKLIEPGVCPGVCKATPHPQANSSSCSSQRSGDGTGT
jgi:hypothetical protein